MHPRAMPLDLEREKRNEITSQWPSWQRDLSAGKVKLFGRCIRISLDPTSTLWTGAPDVTPGLQVHCDCLDVDRNKGNSFQVTK